MRPFRDIPIQQKLTLAIMGTCAAALALALTILFVYNILAFRRELIRDRMTIAELIGTNVTAALTFDDPKTAEEILGTLNIKPHVVAAALYKKDRSLFARYIRTGDRAVFPSSPGEIGSRIENGHLVVTAPIFLEKSRIGSIWLLTDLEGLYDRMKALFLIFAMVVASAFLLARFVTFGFQRAISESILELAKTAKMISEKKEYSIRVSKYGEDELGQLADAFNLMLTEIQKQNKALQKINEDLEEKVIERTKEIFLLQRIAIEVSEAEDVYSALEIVLRIITLETAWCLGQMWITDSKGEYLIPYPKSISQKKSCQKFRVANESLKFARGEGLPGSAWASRKPIWVEHLPDNEIFRRRAAAVEAGLQSGLAIPITIDEKAIAVLEVFSSERRHEDARLFKLVSSIMTQLDSLIKRKQAEEELRLNEKKIQLIIDTAYDAFVAIDSRGIITDWNRQSEISFGWPREEAIGQTLAETIIPPAYREAHTKGMEKFLKTGEGPVLNKLIEITAVNRQGREFPVELTIRPVKIQENYIFNAFIRDITKRKRDEEALRESEERIRLMVEEVKDYAIIMLDPRGYIVSWNTGAERIIGYHAEEIIGQHFSRFYTPEDVQQGKPERELETALRAGRVEDESVRLRKDGSQFLANVVVTPIKDAQGNLRGFSKVTLDITLSRKAEEKRVALLKDLESANRELKEFAYVVS